MFVVSGDNMWHTVYDCEIQEEVLLRILPEVLPADNPQQSASCSHVGLHGNHLRLNTGPGLFADRPVQTRTRTRH